MWGGDRWWGTHTTGHCWGSSGDFHFINPDFIIIIIVTMIIITVGHCWGSSSNINHCKCTLDKHILHFDNCEDHDHDQLMCVEPFEAEEEGTLAAIIINLSIILPLIVVMISWFAWSHLKLRRRAHCQRGPVIVCLCFFLQTRSPLSPL